MNDLLLSQINIIKSLQLPIILHFSRHDHFCVHRFLLDGCIGEVAPSIHMPDDGQLLQGVPVLGVREVVGGFQKIRFTMRLTEVVVFDLYRLIGEYLYLWLSISWLVNQKKICFHVDKIFQYEVYILSMISINRFTGHQAKHYGVRSF